MLGSHIRKSGTFYKSLTECFNQNVSRDPEFQWANFPAQIFTGSTKMWKRPIVDEKDITVTKQYIADNNIKLFIHSIYLINLSRPKEEIVKAKECLIYDLKLGEQLGCKGVVVHVGKALKMGTTLALKNMYDNILEIMSEISEDCPLLIETPAGQGTEVLTKINEFMDFYEKFTEEERLRVKICIDTCHVFAAQKEIKPSEYLVQFYSKYSDALVLVHYNDSKCEHGSCKDRHEYPGEGYIGKEEMGNILLWCESKGIPMVIEN